MEFTVAGIDDLQAVVAHLVELTQTYDCFLLKGDLGAGKTTTVRHWMKALGIEESVSSPTFSLINEYRNSSIRIFHMDMYRLNDIEEALNIGIEEYLDDSEAIKVVEWPGLILDLMIPPYVSIDIELRGNMRHFKIDAVKNN